MPMNFDGTPTTVIATTGTIADGNFTVSGTNATITEFDNSTDLWTMGLAVLSLPDTFVAAPTDGAFIELYMCKQDISSTLDETAPALADQKGAKRVALFRMYATDENQPKGEVFSLAGVRKAKFFLKNSCGQTMSYTAGATVTVEGFDPYPAA